MFLDTDGEYRIFGLSTVPPEELTLISKLSTVIQKDTIPLPLLVEETIGILIYKVGNDGKWWFLRTYGVTDSGVLVVFPKIETWNVGIWWAFRNVWRFHSDTLAGCSKHVQSHKWAPRIPQVDVGLETHPTIELPIGSMYAIYGNIYHQYTVPQMLAYIPYMDPMGYPSTPPQNLPLTFCKPRILRRNWGLWDVMGSNSPSHGTFHGEIDSPWDSKMEIDDSPSGGLKPYQTGGLFFGSSGLKTWGKKKTMDSPCSHHVLHWPSHGTRSSASSKPEAASSAIALAVSCAGRMKKWRGPKSSDWDKRQTKGQWISGWRLSHPWKMMEFVSWDDDFPFPINMESHVIQPYSSQHQPVIINH